MLAAAGHAERTASAVLMLGSAPAATVGDITLVNLGARTLSAWVRCDSWSPDFLATMGASADEWIHLGDIRSRTSLSCAAFHELLDCECELPLLEFAFVPFDSVPGSTPRDLTALVPYDPSRNYQLVLGSAVVITARRPSIPR